MVVIENEKEFLHLIGVLRQTQKALRESNAFALQQLSDQLIHTASIYQHTDSITIMTLVYALNKIVARRDHIKISRWNVFVKKFNTEIDKSLAELEKEDLEEFARHIAHAKELLVSASPAVKTDIHEVLKKAAINKASRIYEHGISMARTANLLGLSPWELAEYLGERAKQDGINLSAYDIKKRAKEALAFFS